MTIYYEGEPFLTTFLRSPEPFYMSVGYVFESRFSAGMN